MSQQQQQIWAQMASEIAQSYNNKSASEMWETLTRRTLAKVEGRADDDGAAAQRKSEQFWASMRNAVVDAQAKKGRKSPSAMPSEQEIRNAVASARMSDADRAKAKAQLKRAKEAQNDGWASKVKRGFKKMGKTLLTFAKRIGPNLLKSLNGMIETIKDLRNALFSKAAFSTEMLEGVTCPPFGNGPEDGWIETQTNWRNSECRSLDKGKCADYCAGICGGNGLLAGDMKLKDNPTVLWATTRATKKNCDVKKEGTKCFKNVRIIGVKNDFTVDNLNLRYIEACKDGRKADADWERNCRPTDIPTNPQSSIVHGFSLPIFGTTKATAEKNGRCLVSRQQRKVAFTVNNNDGKDVVAWAGVVKLSVCKQDPSKCPGPECRKQCKVKKMLDDCRMTRPEQIVDLNYVTFFFKYLSTFREGVMGYGIGRRLDLPCDKTAEAFVLSLV